VTAITEIKTAWDVAVTATGGVVILDGVNAWHMSVDMAAQFRDELGTMVEIALDILGDGGVA